MVRVEPLKSLTFPFTLPVVRARLCENQFVACSKLTGYQKHSDENLSQRRDLLSAVSAQAGPNVFIGVSLNIPLDSR